jgi:predicted anti-sigma-YlaC factor YlaD
MIHAGCVATELLLERRSPSLSNAEGLRVEAHLAECQRCSREHDALVQLLAIAKNTVTSALRLTVRERAIARALSRARAT